MKAVYITYSGKEVGPRIHIAGFLQAFRKLVPELKVYHLHPDFRDPLEEAERREPEPAPPQPPKPKGGLTSRLFGGRSGALLWQLGFFLRNLRSLIRELRIISRERPDLLFVRKSFVVSSMFAAKLKRIPFVWEVNAPLFEKEAFVERRILLPSLLKLLEVKTNQRADALTVVSRSLKDHYVERGVPAERIFVNPNGVDPDRFSPEVSPDRIRKRCGLEGKLAIGFSGGFKAWHGIDSFLDSVPAIADPHPEVRFVLIGAAETEAYSRRIKPPHSDRVIFSGLVPYGEVPEWLAAMDILVAPYPPMEFFYFSPLKIFEYMAMAKPVVASRQGQLGEVISDGENGFLFEPGSLEEMLEKMRGLLDDAELRRRLGEEARRTIMENYTWGHNAQRALEVCQYALRKKRSSPG
jgi:glycosyltransferase involved in cell wall biosynthesis